MQVCIKYRNYPTQSPHEKTPDLISSICPCFIIITEHIYLFKKSFYNHRYPFVLSKILTLIHVTLYINFDLQGWKRGIHKIYHTNCSIYMSISIRFAYPMWPYQWKIYIWNNRETISIQLKEGSNAITETRYLVPWDESGLCLESWF